MVVVNVVGLVHFFVSWAMLALALTIAAWITPGVSMKGGIFSRFLVAALLAFLAWIAHIVVLVVVRDGGIAAQYLFGFVGRTLVLALLLRITSALTERLVIKSFFRAILAALAVSAATTVIDYLVVRVVTPLLA